MSPATALTASLRQVSVVKSAVGSTPRAGAFEQAGERGPRRHVGDSEPRLAPLLHATGRDHLRRAPHDGRQDGRVARERADERAVLDAVLQDGDGRLRAAERAQPVRGAGRLVGLDGEQHPRDRPVRGGRVALDLGGERVLAAVGALDDRRRCGAAAAQDDLVPGVLGGGAERRPDGARADDGDPHGFVPCDGGTRRDASDAAARGRPSAVERLERGARRGRPRVRSERRVALDRGGEVGARGRVAPEQRGEQAEVQLGRPVAARAARVDDVAGGVRAPGGRRRRRRASRRRRSRSPAPPRPARRGGSCRRARRAQSSAAIHATMSRASSACPRAARYHA